MDICASFSRWLIEEKLCPTSSIFILAGWHVIMRNICPMFVAGVYELSDKFFSQLLDCNLHINYILCPQTRDRRRTDVIDAKCSCAQNVHQGRSNGLELPGPFG